MNRRLLYGALATLLAWIGTYLYLNWFPYGKFGSIGISIAGAGIAFTILQITSKILAKKIPAWLQIFLMAITSGGFLLVAALSSAIVYQVTIDCDNPARTEIELNRFEKIQWIFKYSGKPINVRINFPGLAPIWENGSRRNTVTGTAPGKSREYRVNAWDANYDYSFTCGSQPPSDGMIQIPREH